MPQCSEDWPTGRHGLCLRPVRIPPSNRNPGLVSSEVAEAVEDLSKGETVYDIGNSVWSQTSSAMARQKGLEGSLQATDQE